MARQEIYGICGMCTVRCPMMGVRENGNLQSIHGNPHAPGVKGALCARGAAGPALAHDSERPQQPLIRQGERGEGKWKAVSWDEAFDYVAEKINAVRKDYGDRAFLFSDRGGPFRDHPRALLRGLGTPNYCNHDSACARNVTHGALSLFGFDRKGMAQDLRNAKHVVVQTRNIFEAINVKEVNDLLDAMADGCKLTVIDVRANITAGKADNFFMIRPGTDYAFNLAVLHVLIKEKLYDEDFVNAYVKDFHVLETFIEPYSPEFAAKECGVDAGALVDFVRQLAEAAPQVIWHPGWMTARYSDSFYMTRTAYLINALLGALGKKGGLPFVLGPGQVGAKGLKSFLDRYPKPEEKRVDGAGWQLKHIDAGPGLVNLAYKAIKTGEPYPIKAYMAWRHDPFMAFPDPEALKSLLSGLDFMVSVTFSWSDTAWYSDVVLPLSTYLERDSIIITKKGPKPSFAVRKKMMPTVYDTKADWEIVSGLAKRFGLDEIVFDSIEDLWNAQLEGTGVSIADFDKTGSVSLADSPTYLSENLPFKTPSGKVEVVSDKFEGMGIPSLKDYIAPDSPPEGAFRITFGRVGVHTQGHTVNNPLLHEQMPVNTLWINKDRATAMGIADGDEVEIAAHADGGSAGRIKAFVTEFIHPEAVFMVHGFGHKLPCESRAFGKGVADNELMPGGLDKWDPAGGGISMQEHFVVVSKAI